MLSMSSDEEEYSEIATPDLINYDEKKMVTDKYGSISLSIFDLNNDEKRQPDLEKASWLATIKGLAIALFGAGVCYGVQSVCVKELSLQEKPILAMETLAFRSVFQVLVFLPATILSGSNIIPAKEYRWTVFQISVWYIFATVASFQAFTMLIPAAAIGARCSSRTLSSLLLSTFWLKEHILKTEYLSMLLCIIGVATFVTDSLIQEPLVNQEAFSYLSNNWIVIIGFRNSLTLFIY